MKGKVITYNIVDVTYFGEIIDKYREYVTGCSTNQDMYIIRRYGSVEKGNNVICELGYIDTIQPRDFIQFIPMDIKL